MKPLRMCMVCRERFEKHELIRIVKNNSGEISVDLNGKSAGRGAYICRSDKCIKAAQKRKVLERAFSRAIDKSVYEELEKLTEGGNEF